MSSPPLTSSGVFFVRESALIDASREKVWQVLLDLPSYGEWNPFTRKMYVVSESGSTVKDQTLEVGKLFVSAINMPPAGLTPPRMSGTSRVTTLDHDNFRVSWVAHDFPAWFFFYERWKTLTVEGEKTKWETVEVYNGVWAYVIYWLYYKSMLLSLRAMAEALKGRAEAA